MIGARRRYVCRQRVARRQRQRQFLEEQCFHFQPLVLNGLLARTKLIP